MTQGVYIWSRTAGSNATADASVNYSEGQVPSSLNDSARAAMARLAEYRDDIAGAIVTGGTSTAYTLTSYQVFDSLAHMDKQVIAFTPHATNGGFCSLAVDGLTARNIRSAPNVDIPAGTLVQGTPYVAVYNNSDGVFYLRGFFGNPYNIPIGSTIDYWGATAPNSSFVFPYGQAISRTTYATLFALLGTVYGVGDGSTTFNLPDLRGRVTASPDNMGGGSDPARLASGALASVRNSIGGAGGEAAHTITIGELPSHGHTATVTDPGHTHTINSPPNVWYSAGGANIGGSPNTSFANYGAAITANGATTGITVSNAATGGGAVANVMQPTILCNRIMRII